MKNVLRIIFWSFLFIFFAGQTNAQTAPPYIQDFESGPAGWSSYALSGQNDWIQGVPAGIDLNMSNSGTKAWKTKLSGYYSLNSSMCLQTPAFDLSNTTVRYALNFYHKRKFNTGTSAYVQYSTDGGATWNLLNSVLNTEIKNWYNSPGSFTGSNYIIFTQSSISLFFLQGNANVIFRFCLNTSSLPDEGWLIDDFSIVPEYFNVQAVRGDTIKHFAKNIHNMNINTTLAYNNQYSANFTNTTKYYFSNDAILDVSDPLVGTQTVSISGTYPNYNKLIPTPPNLHAGNYYIFFVHDANNNLQENNETDNAEYAVLEVDSTFLLPYTENLENLVTSSTWLTGVGSSLGSSYWQLGMGYRHHLEGAHSGNNAWNTSSTAFSSSNGSHFVRTPYIDMRPQTQPMILSFWYKKFYISNTNVEYSVWGPDNSYFNPLANIPTTLYDDWDFMNITLPTSFDTSGYLSFRFVTSSTAFDQEGMSVDDIYVGPSMPDISIDGDKKDRFVNSGNSSDSLRYLITNCGTLSAGTSATKFYWSTDSIFDGGDILLGTKSENTLAAQSRNWSSFTFTKPTLTAGKYYIFYFADDGNAVQEMRENDNSGYFTMYQQPIQALPYANDFETQITDWRTESSLGHNDWRWSSPTGVVLNQAFSGSKAWITNGNGDTVSTMSRQEVYSPVFDFTNMINPVVEFNGLFHFYDWSYPTWPFNGGNMHYSIDGGASWLVLDTTSRSFKQWYIAEDYEDYGGIDKLHYFENYNQFLFGYSENAFDNNSNDLTYQSRDSKRMTQFTNNISFLAGQPHVQFRFNYTNCFAPTEGMLIDDFSIKEKFIDLSVSYKKNLMITSMANMVRFTIDIENNGNYYIKGTGIDYYLSSDSVLDVSDVLIGHDTIREIRPDRSYFLNEGFSSPPNLSSYHYLIYNIDPHNSIAESNEINNVGWWPLGTDTLVPLPYLNDFSASQINGWNWYTDGTLGYDQYRFRHERVSSDCAFQAQSGEWFLDRINSTISSYQLLPIYYLESPQFNFKYADSLKLSFDFICVGDNSFNSSGGNIQYSLDGGNTWLPYGNGTTFDPNAQNWYNFANVTTLNNEPGWAQNSDYYNFTPASISLMPLANDTAIKFRIQFKSKQLTYQPGRQGFRLDNFRVDGVRKDYDYDPIDSMTLLTFFYNQQPLNINYSIINHGTSNGKNTTTKFYWSTDSIYSFNDQPTGSVNELPIAGQTTYNGNTNITHPGNIVQPYYWLFYFADRDTVMPETNENNNMGSFKLRFNGLGIEEHAGGSVNVFYADNVIHSDVFSSYSEKGARMILIDPLGQIVIDKSIDIVAGENKFDLSTFESASGTYCFRIITNKEQFVKKLFVDRQ